MCFAAKDYPLSPSGAPPVFTVEGRYNVAYDGKSLSRGGKAKLSLELPAQPVGAFLYLAGIDSRRRRGISKLKVVITNGLGEAHKVTRVPVVYAARSGRGNFVNRVEITPFLSPGKNTIAISGYRLQLPEGAFAYAVTPAGPDAPMKLIQAYDGADVGYFPLRPPLGPDSEVVRFRFDPSFAERAGRVLFALTDGDPRRGDEIFGFTSPGPDAEYPEQLSDTDGDGLIDIVDRRIKLTKKDTFPPGIDPANAAGAPEANGGAFSIEEDCLGEVPKPGKPAELTCGIGRSFNVVDRQYTLPAGHEHADFQVQSENPERGDSFVLFLALNELPLPSPNVVPEIEVTKGADPTVVYAPGGDVAFTVVVTNPAWNQEALNLTSLVDSDFGDLALRCTLPQTLAIGQSYSCTFVAGVEKAVEDPHRNTVTARGIGSESGTPVEDTAEAVVNFVDRGLAYIGDRVWLDLDGEGDQDPGEPGINGLYVALWDESTKSLVDWRLTETSGSVSGFYSFTNIPPGSYRVVIIPPIGMRQTYSRGGLFAEALRALLTGEIAEDVDFGYTPGDFTVTKTASIDEGYPGDDVTYIFEVTNTGNITLSNVHVEDPKLGYVGDTGPLLPGASKELTHTGFLLPSCADEVFTPPVLCGTTSTRTGWCSLPNTVTATWGILTRNASDCVNIKPFGSIGDFVWADADRDGVQDAGEPGIPGVTVTLSGGKSATTVTNAAGWYLFANLKNGPYLVSSTDVSGMVHTTPGMIARALGIGEVFLGADFGYALPSPNPDFTVTKTASIDEGYPGDLVTYTFVVINTGAVRLENVVVNDNKLGYIGTVTLDPGQSRTLYKDNYQLPECGSAGLTEVNICNSATIVVGRCSLPNTVTATWQALSKTASDCIDILPYGRIGDYVWEDMDKDGLQDPGEPGLSGVTVTLSGGGGGPVTTTTDAAGGYEFAHLKAGDYVVDSGGKAGYDLTTGNDPMNVSLGIGETYLLADFGYWGTSPTIAVTKVANPAFGYIFPSDAWPNFTLPRDLDVAYTVEVTNHGPDEALENVIVTDDPATLIFTYQSGDTNGDGRLDLTEKWVYSASWSYGAAGTYPDTVTATGTGVVSGKAVIDTADASVEVISCGQCLGKVNHLALRWNLAAATVKVVVANNVFTNDVAFLGDVQTGGVFEFSGLNSANPGFDGTLGTNILIYANGVFVATVHTSCSQPVFPGQDWGPNGALAAGASGPVTVVEVSSLRGGEICPSVEK